MKSKYVVFALTILLTLSSTSAVLAIGPVLNAGQTKLVGPHIKAIDYSGVYSDSAAETAMNNPNVIQAFDLSWSTGSYTTLQSDISVQTGSTSGFSFDGIYFNELAPIVNTSTYHRAIAFLWDATQFQNVYLGVSGYDTPAIFPCQAFSAGCSNYPACPHTGLCTPQYGVSPNLLAAGTQLLNTKWGNGTLALCAVNTPGSCVPTSGTASLTSSTVWHAGGSHAPWNGPVFTPIWFYRTSLLRIYFSQIIEHNAGLIGLQFYRAGNGKIGPAGTWVFDASAAAVSTPAHYCASGPCKGQNVGGVYNYAAAAHAYGGAAYAETADNWAMYSYGFSAGPDFIGSTQFFNSQFDELSTITMGDVHNASADLYANKVQYASSPGAAASSNRYVALYQLQNLWAFNVYFEDTLWGAYINGWSGYSNTPAYGPDTGAGLDFTALNVYRTCYQVLSGQTCDAGTFNVGLGDYPVTDGGLNPLYGVATVYDVDVQSNIFDSPLVTPPPGYLAPEKYTNWMTTSFTTTHFTGTTGTGPGWFNLQAPNVFAANDMHAGVGQHVVKGEYITLNFQPNLYWSDGAPVTASDYNFSLWLSGVAGYNVSCYPCSSPATVDYGLLSGPLGIVATHVVNSLSVQVYLNTTSVWDFGFIQIPMMPAHIWQVRGLWNLTEAFSSLTTVGIDTAQNPATAAMIGNTGPGWFNETTLPSWMSALPNLEVGTGPFILRTTNEVFGTALLQRNPLYYRPFWQYSAYNHTDQDLTPHTNFALSVLLNPLQYNPTVCASSADLECNVPIASAGGTFGSAAALTGWVSAGPAWQVISATGHPLTGKGGALTCSASTCTASIPYADLTSSFNHIQVYIPYTEYGQNRVWYQSIGEYGN